MEQIQTRQLNEKKNGIANFTAQFWKDKVLLGGTKLPLGQVSADVLNLDLQKLQDLRLKNDRLFRSVLDMLNPKEKLRPDQVTKTQELFNDTTNVVLDLPLYQYLKLDEKEMQHMFTAPYIKNPTNFERAMKIPNQISETTLKMIQAVCKIPDEMITFSVHTQSMLSNFFERLELRQPEYYAIGVYDFFTNELVQRDLAHGLMPFSGEGYFQSRPVSFEYVTMPNPDDKKKYIITERLEFHTAAAFLHTDFYRGLIQGNAPRKCHNCGWYFLLTEGYNTCYCNNIAPGETEKTCRKIGPHRKQSNPKGKTPAQTEYKIVYDRLKMRKHRGKISTDEWNSAVAKALEWKDKAERGEINDSELKEILGGF